MVALSKGMGKKNPLKKGTLPAIKAGPSGVAKNMKGSPFSKATVSAKGPMPKSK
jgi:hypothetical protein